MQTPGLTFGEYTALSVTLLIFWVLGAAGLALAVHVVVDSLIRYDRWLCERDR